MSSNVLTWNDRDTFELGALYVSGTFDEVLEFVGVVTVRAATAIVGVDQLDRFGNASSREPVLLFLNDGVFWPSTRRDSERGETFQTVDDRAGDEIDRSDQVAAQRRTHSRKLTEPSAAAESVEVMRAQIDQLDRLISSFVEQDSDPLIPVDQLREARRLLTRVIEAFP